MSKPKTPLGDRFYGGLLRLLPFDFRSEFGSEMEETFREQRADTGRERGVAALLRMWWATIADIFRMAPREHLSVLAQDARYAGRMMRKNLGYTAGRGADPRARASASIRRSSALCTIGAAASRCPTSRATIWWSCGSPRAKVGQRQHRLLRARRSTDYRQQNRSLSGSRGVPRHDVHAARREPKRTACSTGVVSAGFFDFFGVKPLLGRTFVAGRRTARRAAGAGAELRVLAASRSAATRTSSAGSTR